MITVWLVKALESLLCVDIIENIIAFWKQRDVPDPSFLFLFFFLAMRQSHNVLSRNQGFLFLIAENCIETKVWTLGKNTRVDGGQKYSNHRCCWTVFSSDRARNVYMNLHRCFLFSSLYYYTISVLLCFVFKNCSVYDFIDHLDFLLF